ncbi:MAG: D-alanine--D-alanine ligase [Rhodospirillales bacterium]|nr:MAG: D-alanine--D-alanine ligase [Rhodospirillales bacterium]
MRDVVRSAVALDRRGGRHALAPADLGFTYRHCAVPEDWIFVEATLRAAPGDAAAIGARIEEIDRARGESQPRSRTGGSTFTNPPGHKAWELIDRAGCRGLRIGGAQVSEKHCNFLINTGEATARRHRGAGRGGAPPRAGRQRRGAAVGDPADRRAASRRRPDRRGSAVVSKRVALLKGGWSPEREVSLASGAACADALREAGYDVVEIDVTRDLRALVDALRPLAGGGPDVVFNALHGRWGEDGCIQGVLEILAIPYTHSGVLASSLAMDKEMSRKVYASIGLRCAEGMVIERRALLAGDPMPRPYVVKPVDQGSSIGVHIVGAGDNLAAVESAEARFGDRVLVERFVPGRELTVAVLGDRSIAVTELRPKVKFYDYEAKYTDGVTEHIVPAPVPRPVYDAAMDWALAAHRALGCEGLTRSDFRWDDSRPGTEGLHILETNTQPGMTPLSLAPEQAGWAGMSFPELMSWMVERARCPS